MSVIEEKKVDEVEDLLELRRIAKENCKRGAELQREMSDLQRDITELKEGGKEEESGILVEQLREVKVSFQQCRNKGGALLRRRRVLQEKERKKNEIEVEERREELNESLRISDLMSRVIDIRKNLVALAEEARVKSHRAGGDGEGDLRRRLLALERSAHAANGVLKRVSLISRNVEEG